MTDWGVLTRGKLWLGCVLCLLLAAVPVSLLADTVHHYTNVTMNPGHFLIPEGTLGATLFYTWGPHADGKGGDGTHLYDDSWIGGSTPAGNANAFDRYWYQIYWGDGTYRAYFDLGAQFSQVYIALSQDHGPYPEEALEYRVYVSNDQWGSYTELGATTPITMFRGGWSTAGEGVPGEDWNGNGVYNDDYSAMWYLGGSYRYIALGAVRPDGGYDEPEIDALTGVVPEPSTLLLFGFGSAALAWRKRRKS